MPKERNAAERLILEQLDEDDHGQIVTVWCDEHHWLTTINPDGSPHCNGKPHRKHRPTVDEEIADYINGHPYLLAARDAHERLVLWLMRQPERNMLTRFLAEAIDDLDRGIRTQLLDEIAMRLPPAIVGDESEYQDYGKDAVDEIIADLRKKYG